MDTSSCNQREASQLFYMRQPFHYSSTETPTLPGNMVMYVNSRSYSDALSGDVQLKTNYDDIPAIGSSNSTLQQHDMLVTDLTAAQNILSQGLSLSLGTQMPPFVSPNPSTSGEIGNQVNSSGDNHSRILEYFPAGKQYFNKEDYEFLFGMSDVARIIPNSKYLKAAQQLLDEVVNVCKESKLSGCNKNKSLHQDGLKSSKDIDGGLKDDTAPAGAGASASVGVSPNLPSSSGNFECELSHSERQDLQNKMTNLLPMLDVVDRRYREYCHQMQIVVSSLDAVAGCGAAKPYTAVALQTISKHFRCLYDAITTQIRATRVGLGEQDYSGNDNAVVITRLRLADQQLRQQKALQQIVMMQQNAWRPQRGLPESSVSVLRAWLFEHFLHPYPKDSDKMMLARQTGLSRNQVSNWFINARVRLWKPMVEEMYKQEVGDGDGDEMDTISSPEFGYTPTKGDDATTPAEAAVDLLQPSQSATTNERYMAGYWMESNLDIVPDVETRREEKSNDDDCSVLTDAVVQSSGGGDNKLMAAAAAYHITQLQRNGVSLTLGLQHFEDAAHT